MSETWTLLSDGSSLDVDGALSSMAASVPAATPPPAAAPGAGAGRLHAVKTGTLTLACNEGHITFSREEAQAYRLLYLVADVDCVGTVSRAEGLALLRFSRLPDAVLAEVWRLACGGDGAATTLSFDGWFVAMKLIALAQRTSPPQVRLRPLLGLSPPIGAAPLPSPSDDGSDADGPAAAATAFALPDFGLGSEREVGTDAGEPIARGAIAVTVGGPVTVHAEGALATVGLGSSHISYPCCCTTTRTDDFVRPETRVSRRFSDFVWLHNRLQEKFLDTVVPPLPGKRIVGNTDSAFLEERRQMLTLFINHVACHAKLSRSAEFGVFVGASTRGVAAAIELAPPLPPRAEPGYISSIWEGARSYIVGPEVVPPALQTDDAYRSVETRVRRFEAQIGRTEVAVSAMVQADKARAYELARVGHYMGQVSLCELPSSAEHAVFSALAEAFEHASNALSDRSDRLVADFVNPLRFQSGKASAAQQVVSNREQMVAELRGALRRQARAKKAYASARLSSTGGQRSKLAEQASESKIAAERTIGDAAEALDQITQGMKKQVSDCADECGDDLGRILQTCGRTMRDDARAERQRWVQLRAALLELQQQRGEDGGSARAAAAAAGAAAAAPAPAKEKGGKGKKKAKKKSLRERKL